MNKREKLTKTTLLVTILLLSSILPLVFAGELPTIPGDEEYHSDYGVLDTDTYILYPYEEESINVGFSKYGELIDRDTGLGLEYKGVDVFANSMITPNLWCNGWIMDIHYTEGGYLRNTWAYALFSDRSGPGGVDGEWRNWQLSEDGSAPGDTHGGRRTNGYAESEDIKLLYDGPRKAIYLLNTTIYDKDANQQMVPLVTLTIQLVFDKVSKNVMEIKDIKRVDDNKMNGPFQIEFSQRAEWDIGLTTASESYAEFYNDIPTEYDKHPFYTNPHESGGHEVTFDLCQIIGEEDLVGYAAFWPPLISKWVTNTEEVRRYGVDIDVPSLLTTMETYEQYAELPTSASQLVDPTIMYDAASGEIWLLLTKEPVEYPRGNGEWTDAPWLFKKDSTGRYAKLLRQTGGTPGAWYWDPTIGPNGAVRIKPFQWNWGNEFCIVFKRVMMGHTPHESTALNCMPWEGFQEGDIMTTYGMYNEPDTPYVFAEWDFDLDYDVPQNSTHQFRCVSVYGLTDNHNAVDPNEGLRNEFLIDKEVVYQLEQIFNPIDLKEAAHKDTFRWAQKGTMSATIQLTSHLYDKYGNSRPCLDGEHVVWVPEKWGYYCQDSEKVLAYTSSGQVLLERGIDYTIDGNLITILNSHGADTYKVLYTTVLLPGELVLDETDFAPRKETTTMFGVDVKREFMKDYVKWTIDFDENDIAGHWASGADLIINAGCKVFKIRSSDVETYFKLWDESITDFGPAMPLPEGIEIVSESRSTTSTDPDYWEIMIPYEYLGGKCFEWAMYLEASWPGHSSSEQMIFPENWAGLPDSFSWYTPTLNMYQDGVCWSVGRWEWTVLGESSLPSDSLGATMLVSGWSDWKNVECWLSGLDIQSVMFAPSIPSVMRTFADSPPDLRYYHEYPDDLRTSFRDDWCTPDNWNGELIRPYAVSSSNILIVGGPEANLAAYYSNDFTDALIYTEYGDGFYAPGCWARTTQDHWLGNVFVDVDDNVLWYNSVDVNDPVGHAIVSVYKDLNETVGFVVYGYTAEDTYYTCYALRGGLLDWLQHLQNGVTTIVIEIDYNDIHPVQFHIKECVGPFTECTGFNTSFKNAIYDANKETAEIKVETRANCLGICYKLVDISWCAQVHPDP